MKNCKAKDTEYNIRQRYSAITTAVLALCVLNTYIPVLSQAVDAQVLTVWTIEDTIPVTLGAGELCDLTNSVYMETLSRKYRFYGDTLLTRTTGKKREIFKIAGDTVKTCIVNTRTTVDMMQGGCVYYINNDDVRASYVFTDTVYTTACGIEGETNIIKGKYETWPSGRFLFPDLSVADSTCCVHTSVSDTAKIVDDYRWYVPSSPFPVVQYVSTTKVTTGEKSTKTILCPLSEHPSMPISRSKMPTRNSKSQVADSSAGGQDMLDITTHHFHITQKDGVLSVSSLDKQDPDGGFTVSETVMTRLYDAAGRKWDERNIPASYDTRLYPEGAYILEISTYPVPETYKIHISH